VTPNVLSAVLTHQGCKQIDALVQWWSQYVDPNNLLIVHTGPKEEFCLLLHPRKAYVADQRLQTRDHPRELQSYTSVFRAIAKTLRQGRWDYVNFCEYDQLPLRGDADAGRVQCMEQAGADVLGYQVRRIDGTNHPHWLYYQARVRHGEVIRRISRRADLSVVLSMFGSGSFWKRRVLEDVAALEEPMPIYLELWLPTIAHHLGYRIVGMGDRHERWVSPGRDRSAEIQRARKSGAWSVHPVKSLPMNV
jgi:hypothetical protein